MYSYPAPVFSVWHRHAARILMILSLIGPCVAASAQEKLVAGVPGAIKQAENHGQIDPSTPLKLTVWLTMHNRQEFDQRVEALYTPGSPSYHHWLTSADLVAYAPTKSEIQTVTRQLENNGLTVRPQADDPFALRVTGSAESVQATFGVEIDTFEKNGLNFHANVNQASISEDAAPLILSVRGLHNIQMMPLNAHVGDPKAATKTDAMKQPAPLTDLGDTADLLSSLFTIYCFQTPATETLGSPGQLPVGDYYGNFYGLGNRSCAYTPAQMQNAYGLQAVYDAGLRGEGQTIVLIDPYGSSTIQSDANSFSVLTGLPTLTSTSFQQLYPDGQPQDPSFAPLYLVEVSTDVEWSHALAPAANIILVAAPSGDDQDLQNAMEYAVTHKLGNILSGSFGIPEVELEAQDLDTYNQIIEQAAAVGIAVNFASGNQSDLGLGTPEGAVVAPADSPYATAVGGTSIGIPGGVDAAHEVGWGHNYTYLAFDPSLAQDPPYNYGNVDGSGGGWSLHFLKPAWQKALPGKYRLDPDVALDADPFTGAVLVYTDPTFGAIIEPTGGTGLATSMFSAFWALADEKAGRSLGQAAPILSRLQEGALHDIVPVTSSTDVIGTTISSTGVNFYSAADLAAPLEATTEFVSALWQTQGESIDLTFGTDGSLTTTKGWDDVTGYGTPAGIYFVNDAAKQ